MFILMHKDIPVAQIQDITNGIINVTKIINKEHLPVGTRTEHFQLQSQLLTNWNRMRSIPESRQDVNNIRRKLKNTIQNVKTKTLFVSLTDCYWIKSSESSLSWKDVDYHSNGFSNGFAEAVLYDLHETIKGDKLPDLTTDGNLSKAWLYSYEVPILLKQGDFGPNANGQQLLCANEVAASQIAKEMGIRHVDYYPVTIRERGIKVCASECFIKDSDSEFINSLQIKSQERLPGGKAFYDYFTEYGFKKEIDQMILFDYLIRNTDRHEKNFGLIRDPDTLDIIEFAPIFDSGSCLNWDYRSDIEPNNIAKPFCESRKEQLQLISLNDIILPDKNTVCDIVQKAYEEFNIKEDNFKLAITGLEDSYESISALLKNQWAPGIQN